MQLLLVCFGLTDSTKTEWAELIAIILIVAAAIKMIKLIYCNFLYDVYF